VISCIVSRCDNYYYQYFPTPPLLFLLLYSLATIITVIVLGIPTIVIAPKTRYRADRRVKTLFQNLYNFGRDETGGNLFILERAASSSDKKLVRKPRSKERASVRTYERRTDRPTVEGQ